MTMRKLPSVSNLKLLGGGARQGSSKNLPLHHRPSKKGGVKQFSTRAALGFDTFLITPNYNLQDCHLPQGCFQAGLLGYGQCTHGLPACAQFLHLDLDPGGVVSAALDELSCRAFQGLHAAGPLPQFFLENLERPYFHKKLIFHYKMKPVKHSVEYMCT